MKALRAENTLMKEDTIRIVKDVQDQCIQSLVDLSANFNSAVDLIRNEFQAIMRAEREERLQDQQLQHENSVVLQGCYDRHHEDIIDLFGRYHWVQDQGNNLDEVQRVTNHWLGLVHNRLCKCPPINTLPPITQRPFPVPPSDPIVASPMCSSSCLSYADVLIQGEDVNVGVSTSGPSSNPSFVPFSPTDPSSSSATTMDEAP